MKRVQLEGTNCYNVVGSGEDEAWLRFGQGSMAFDTRWIRTKRAVAGGFEETESSVALAIFDELLSSSLFLWLELEVWWFMGRPRSLGAEARSDS